MIVEEFAQALLDSPTEGLIIYEDDIDGSMTRVLVNQYQFNQQDLMVASMSTVIKETFPEVGVHNVPLTQILNVRRSRPIRGVFLRYDCDFHGNEDTNPKYDIELVRKITKTTTIVAIDLIVKARNHAGPIIGAIVIMLKKGNVFDVEKISHPTKSRHEMSQFRLFCIMKLKKHTQTDTRVAKSNLPIHKKTTNKFLKRLVLLEERVDELLEVVKKYS